MQLKIVAIFTKRYILIMKRQKLIERLLLKPKDFTWSELITVLNGFGYEEIHIGKTGGSRVRFIHDRYPTIILHKPHPRPILKGYQLKDILALLQQEGLL